MRSRDSNGLYYRDNTGQLYTYFFYCSSVTDIDIFKKFNKIFYNNIMNLINKIRGYCQNLPYDKSSHLFREFISFVVFYIICSWLATQPFLIVNNYNIKIYFMIAERCPYNNDNSGTRKKRSVSIFCIYLNNNCTLQS